MENYDGMTYAQLGSHYLMLKDELADIATHKKEVQARFDNLRLTVIPEKMEQDEMSSVNIKGVGRLGLTLDAYVTVLAASREDFYSWLEANGHGGLIKPYAQPATVKAFIKEQVKEGNDFPEELVKCEPFFRASVTKK